MPKDTTSKVLQMHVTKAHMQIGHDAVHMINGFGRVMNQSPYGLWGALIQSGKEGEVRRSIVMRDLCVVHHRTGTYGTFLKSYVFPTAEKLGAQLEELSEKDRTSRLDDLVVRATLCSRTYWVLSANPVRRFLYPGAYDAESPRRHRIDRLFYVPDEDRDRFFTGGFMAPRSLDRAEVDRWKSEISEEFPSYDVDRFGPVTA